MNVLVAGASRGIGSALADHLVDAGHSVAGLARANPDEWQVRQEVMRLQCDLAAEREVRKAFSALRKEDLAPWLVVHVAGAFSADLLVTAPDQRLRDVMVANVATANNVFRESARSMARTGGRVVALSSIAAGIPLPGNGLYAASKVALESLVRSYALEARGANCTFNALRVSFVRDTGMVDALEDEARSRYAERLIAPTDMDIAVLADVISLLASPSGAWISGEVVSLGGPV
jgi:NAD(P)-dependent dehydrogenase (short-subunit alcohol dehydrogenase family)